MEENELENHHRETLVSLKELLLEKVTSLRELIFSEIKGLREFLVTRIEAIDKATALLAQTMAEKFESVNEFRGQLKDQMGTFATLIAFKALDDRLNEHILKDFHEFQDIHSVIWTKAEHSVFTKNLDEFRERNTSEIREIRETLSEKADTVFMQNLLSERLKSIDDRIVPLENSKNFLAGKASQISVTIALCFSGLSAIGTIIAIIKVFSH